MTKIHIPYTRLVGTPIMDVATRRYAENDLDYHNFPHHVVSNYGHMERLGFGYDVNFDLGNLLHDVIMGRDAEIRSIAFAREHAADVPGADIDKVSELIGTTIEHSPAAPDPRLAMVDLMSFASAEHVRNSDTELLLAEALKVKGDDFDLEAWAGGTLAYLNGLHDRIVADLPRAALSPVHRLVWRDVAEGALGAVAYVEERYAGRGATLSPDA